MNKTCNICHGDGTFKCPTCLIFYCSLACCKKHRETKCGVVNFDLDEDVVTLVRKTRKRKKSLSPDINEKIKLPKNGEQSTSSVNTAHSRNLTVKVDEAENVEKVEENPILDLSTVYLKVNEPQTQGDELCVEGI